jgi:hypothetical protein
MELQAREEGVLIKYLLNAIANHTNQHRELSFESRRVMLFVWRPVTPTRVLICPCLV